MEEISKFLSVSDPTIPGLVYLEEGFKQGFVMVNMGYDLLPVTDDRYLLGHLLPKVVTQQGD